MIYYINNFFFKSPLKDVDIFLKKMNYYYNIIIINPLASPSARAPVLNYGDVNTETTSPGEVKGLIKIYMKDKIISKI